VGAAGVDGADGEGFVSCGVVDEQPAIMDDSNRIQSMIPTIIIDDFLMFIFPLQIKK
jgi:hypothetical protein